MSMEKDMDKMIGNMKDKMQNIDWCRDKLNESKLNIINGGKNKMYFNGEAVVHVNVISRTIEVLESFDQAKSQIIDLIIEGLLENKVAKVDDSFDAGNHQVPIEVEAYNEGFNKNKDQTIKYLKGLKGERL